MKVVDELRLARGVVSPSFVDLSTGKRVPFAPRNNKLSYMAAEAVAAAFGGDPSYIPARIGFIYGDNDIFEAKIEREQSWDELMEDLGGGSGGSAADVQIVGFSYAPTLGGEKRAPSGDSGSSGGSSDPTGDDYCHILSTGSNAITFHAVSNSQDKGAMFGTDTFHSGSYIYQCVLLGYHAGKYYVIARASLKDFSQGGEGRYLRKPDGFEVALDWTVVFH
jgi:hypothetical protein